MKTGDEFTREIFAELDRILETGVLHLYGATLEIPVRFNISVERSRMLFGEWVTTAITRYQRVVDSDGAVYFRLRSGSGNHF